MKQFVLAEFEEFCQFISYFLSLLIAIIIKYRINRYVIKLLFSMTPIMCAKSNHFNISANILAKKYTDLLQII